MDNCFLASLSSIMYLHIVPNDIAGKIFKSSVNPSTGKFSLSFLALISSMSPRSALALAKWIPPSGSFIFELRPPAI